LNWLRGCEHEELAAGARGHYDIHLAVLNDDGVVDENPDDEEREIR
jgi:hypothetical protein